MAAAVAVSGHWRRLHTLGRGASGAVVSLAADASSGELFAVKSSAHAAAASLRRERAVLVSLSSPHVVRCVGGAEGADGSYQLFLEYAPGGSLADAAARNGGSLGERAARAYAADVARGLAYLHARSVVHGDLKARNVVIGADGRAKLADFGCAILATGGARAIGGTPAFMAPEVARGEDQGPAADVWALGCTVVEMVTGRAPWSRDTDDVLAALHLIGRTDATPEVPSWLSAEAKDFLACCFARDAADRWTAAELLEHPFLASAGADEKADRWVSPKSTLDAAAFWDSSESDDEEDEMAAEGAAERIKSLACPASAFPDWDREEGCWIDVLGVGEQRSEVQVAISAPSKLSVPAGGFAVGGGVLSDDELETEDVPFAGDAPAADDASVGRQSKRCLSSGCRILEVLPFQLGVLCCNEVVDGIKLWFHVKFAVVLCFIFLVRTLLTPNCSSNNNLSARLWWPRSVPLPHSTVNTRACNGRLLGCNGIKLRRLAIRLQCCSAWCLVSSHSHFTPAFG
jgi:serine/threonine protein kinase